MPDVEWYIQTIKDQTRSAYQMLPFRCIPRIMLIHLVKNAVLWLNAFPAEDGVSSQHSPWLMIPQTMMGAVCLGPTGNNQGGHWFMSLTSGARRSRHCWTELPMPREAINDVTAIGRSQHISFPTPTDMGLRLRITWMMTWMMGQWV